MLPLIHRVDSRYPGVARKVSPGAIVIIRPVGDSTVIGKPSWANSKAQTSPSPPHCDRNRIASSAGTRRKAEERLTVAGRLPPFIRVDAHARGLAMGNASPLAGYGCC